MTHREHRSFGRSTVKLATSCHSVSHRARRCIILACLVLGSLLFSMSLVAGQEMSPVQKGQTATQVRQKLGPPWCVSRQILFRRHVEQWHYEACRRCGSNSTASSAKSLTCAAFCNSRRSSIERKLRVFLAPPLDCCFVGYN